MDLFLVYTYICRIPLALLLIHFFSFYMLNEKSKFMLTKIQFSFLRFAHGSTDVKRLIWVGHSRLAGTNVNGTFPVNKGVC